MNESDRRLANEVRDEPMLPYAASLDRSPSELDEAILAASRRAVRFHRLHVLLEKLQLSPGASWALLLGLVIGVPAGVGLGTLIGDKAESVPSGLIHAGDPALSPSLDDSDESEPTPSPEPWLRHIAALVLDGRTTEAEFELRAFRQSYPSYGDTDRQ